MQPDQDQNNQQQTTPTSKPAQTSLNQPPQLPIEPPIYRQYWPFAIIFIFIPFGLIIGIILLVTGSIYRNKDGTYQPISKKEKNMLIVVATIFSLIGYGRILFQTLFS